MRLLFFFNYFGTEYFQWVVTNLSLRHFCNVFCFGAKSKGKFRSEVKVEIWFLFPPSYFSIVANWQLLKMIAIVRNAFILCKHRNTNMPSNPMRILKSANEPLTADRIIWELQMVFCFSFAATSIFLWTASKFYCTPSPFSEISANSMTEVCLQKGFLLFRIQLGLPPFFFFVQNV